MAPKKPTPAQQAWLRKKLGPALLKAGPMWVGLGFKIPAKVEAMPAGTPKPELEPFSLPLLIQLLFPLGAIGSVIRRAVVEHLDPEEVHAKVSAQVVEILKAMLKDETEASVLSFYSFIHSEVDRIFSESGLWKALNEADEVFVS